MSATFPNLHDMVDRLTALDAATGKDHQLVEVLRSQVGEHAEQVREQWSSVLARSLFVPVEDVR